MWTCPVCAVPCQDTETQCPACETAKPGHEKPKPDLGAPVLFGAGPIETNNVPNPFGQVNPFGQPAAPLPTFNPFAEAGPVAFGTQPALFGAGSATFGCQSATFGGSTAQPGSATFGGGETDIGSQPTDGSRFTFGRSDPLARPLTPEKGFRSPTTFCAAMETPAPGGGGEGPLLLGVAGELKVNAAAAGLLTCEEGAVYTWGSGECDQLAVRTEHMDDDGVRRTPIVIKRLAKPIASRVCCGTMHSVAIVDGGKTVYTWGCNDEGALGRPCKTQQITIDVWDGVEAPAEGPERHHAKVPAAVWGIPTDCEVRAVSAGDSHTALITTAGDCYCWGAYRDSWGPIGFPLNFDGRHCPKQAAPVKVAALKGSCMELVSGENHTAVMTYSSHDKKERLYLWGANDFGQLGLPPSTAVDDRRRGFIPIEWTVAQFEFKQPAPRKDENEATVLLTHPDNAALKARGSLLRIFAGQCTTFFTVDLNGEARTFGFGRNASGELGCGSSEAYIHDPVEVLALKGCRFKDIKGGDYFTVALSHDGSVFTWGHREYVGLGRKIGQGDANVLRPTLVPGLKQKARAIGAGSKTAYVLTMDGRLFAWGDNQVAQIGDGTDNDDPVLIPTYVKPELFGNGYVIDIAGGAQHAIALVKQFAPGEISTNRGEKRRREDEEELSQLTAEKKPRLTKQADLTPNAPPPTPVFAQERPLRVLPDDIAEDLQQKTPLILAAEARLQNTNIDQILPEEEDSVPHIKRPVPAPAEPASPVLTSAAKRLKAEDLLDEFGDDPGHDADVSNNLDASQIEDEEPSTVVPPSDPPKPKTKAKAKSKAKAKAKSAKKVDRSVSEKEAIDMKEAEQELDEAPVQRRRAAPKKQASRRKQVAPSPPKRVTRSRAAKNSS